MSDDAPDDLTLILAGQAISGWTDIRVTRGIERCPSDFSVGLTELYPGELDTIQIPPFSDCTVKLGNETVITGYVDRFVPRYSGDSHSIQVIGRSKCADLVDCSATCPTGQINNATILTIAQILAKPYGITVRSTVQDWPVIPQCNLNFGDSAYDTIQFYANYSGALIYDQPDGSLLLAKVNTAHTNAAFTEGVNVQEASVAFAGDQRYQEYAVMLQSTNPFSDIGNGEIFTPISIKDPNCPRYRNLIMLATGTGGIAVAKQRATWESARRAGRSKIVTLTTDTWRDPDGKLWEPNTMAQVSLPKLKLDSSYFTIGEVSYAKDAENGTTAELVLMGSASYQPEPVQLMPLALEFSNDAGL